MLRMLPWQHGSIKSGMLTVAEKRLFKMQFAKQFGKKRFRLRRSTVLEKADFPKCEVRR